MLRLSTIVRTTVVTIILALAIASAAHQGSIVAAHPRASVLSVQAEPTAQQPTLLSSDPANGAAWHGEPVTLAFDRPMSAESADYLIVWPEVAGATTVEAERVIFSPSETPLPGQRYTFTLAAKATTADGVRLERPVMITIEAAMPLRVTSTQPSDGAADVGIDTSIVVVFNRPVVPLTGIDGQADLPQPLTIEPPVEGAGQWINTSIYAFEPALGLAGGSDYTVTVDDVTGTDGETLDEPLVFAFSTATPIVLESQPMGEQVPPDSNVQVSFSQPMDVASTEAAFSLTTDGAPTDGDFEWHDTGTSLTFVPASPLNFGARYAITVGEEALPASLQGSLRAPYSASFGVVPLPAVVSTSPIDGQSGVPTDRTVTIRFSAPLSYTTVLDNIQVTPVLTNTRVYSSYSDYMGEATLNWSKEPDTTYTVTVGSDVADLYGNRLGEETVFSFTTGDHPAFTRINLPDRFTHFTASSAPMVNAYYRNMDELTTTLYRLPMSEFDRLTGPNQWEVWQDYAVPDPEANLLWSRPYLPDVGHNVVGEIHVELNDADGEPLPPGIYLLEMNSPPGSLEEGEPRPQQQKVIVLSDYNLTLKRSQDGNSLVWKTDLQTGQPTGDEPVELRINAQTVGQAATDGDGVAIVRATPSDDFSYAPMLAVSGQPGEAGFAAVSTDWNEGIGPWEYDIPSAYGAVPYQSFFYTDRPIYRPGQTVFWKGIIRAYVDDEYRLPPPDMGVQIMVRDDRGNEIYRETATPGEHGTIFGHVPLAPEATSGYYYVEASLPEDVDGQFYGGVGFQVASYRPPEFEVSVTPDKAENLQGDTVRVDVDASYFSGGPLTDAPVDWRLITSPYYFNWQNAPDGRYFSFQPYDPDEFDFDPYRYTYYGGLVQEGTGSTDDAGVLTIELPADLSDSLTSQNWRLDATVQSSTNQFVNAAANVPVHRAEFVIGLSPRSSVAPAGEGSTTDVVTLEALGSPENAPYPGAELDVTAYEFIWNSVYTQAADGSYRWENDVERTPVYSTTVTTGRDGMGEIVWTPPRGGQYQIEARGQDSAGNEISSVTYLWAAGGDEPVAWRRENHDRIELVADKDHYAPGETARILVPSPFSGPVEALVTIERSGVIESSVVTLEGNSELIDIPITAEHIPNIFVSVVLVKGVDETNPTPAIRVGNVELPVDVSQKELTIEVEPSATQVRPGKTISYTLTVRDFAGKPVPDAEVSAAVVDKAVLALANMDDRPLIDVFYYRRGLGIETGATLIINHDRLSRQLNEGAKGGGGGGGGGPLEVREEFADLAFWHADFVTDDRGRIAFEVTLPDNLTTWVLTAKAVTQATEVGDATHEVIATKELQVRPLLPRFLTAGDRARLGVAVVNTSDQAIEAGTLAVSVEGATVESGDLERTFSLAPGEQVRFDWTVVAPAESAEFTFAASAVSTSPDDEALADAVRVAVPINRYETPEVVGTSGTVPLEGRTETIVVPDEATDVGALLVGLEASLAAGLVDGLDYLAHYPYECNEQSVSRFLPNLFTMGALHRLAIDDPALADQLAFQLGVGVQQLTSRQNGDGGWGYWPGEESSPFITSYVLWGLATADGLGYVVPTSSMEAAVAYLERTFVAPSDVAEDWQLNEMAFTHFVLSEIGQGDPGRASTLYDVRERLALYGKAYLAMALGNMNPEETEDPRVDTLLDDLFGATVFSATGASWHEEGIDFETLNTDTRTTAIVLDAFVRLDPEQPMLEQAVRWLMSARQAGRWATTQENAWSIIALTDWLAASSELEADYAWLTTLNDEKMGSGTFDADSLRDQVELRADIADLLRDQANVLNFSRDDERGQLYYTTYLRYAIDALAVDARDRGVVVARRFEDEDGEPINSAQVGDVISVTTTIVVPADRHHLLVEVPIPAGTEPVDTSLATEGDRFAGPELMPVDEPYSAWTPSYTDIRDDRVALMATTLPAGTYEHTFQVRPVVPGEYRVLPVYAEEMYFPDVWGRGAGQLFSVLE